MTTTADDRRAAELRAQGKSWREIAQELEGTEPTNADGTPLSALAALGDLQANRAALSSGGGDPAAEPPGDPRDAALEAASRARVLGQSRPEAYIEELFAQAASGDPRIVGVSAMESRERFNRVNQEREIAHGFLAQERMAGGGR